MDVSTAGEILPLWQYVLTALFFAWLIPGCWYICRLFSGVKRTGGWVSVADVIPADLAGAALLANLFLASGLIGIFSAMAPEPETPRVPGPGMILVSALLYLALYLFIAGLLGFTLKRRGSGLKSFLGLDKPPLILRAAKGLLILAAALPLLYLISSLWTVLLTKGFGLVLKEQDPVTLFRTATSPLDIFGIIFLAVVVAPLGEELIFRGYLLPVLKRYVGRWPAILGTGLFFGVIHGNWAAAAALALLGILLALAYEHTGSLVTPITMHMVFNSITVVILLFTVNLPEALPKPTDPAPLPVPEPTPAGTLLLSGSLAEALAKLLHHG